MKKGLFIGTLAVLLVLAGGVALAAGPSYQAFRQAMGIRAPQINEANFDRYNEMHRMMAEGDYQGAQAIRQDLGIGRGQGRGCQMAEGGTCPMAKNGGGAFVDQNKNGICDHRENLQ